METVYFFTRIILLGFVMYFACPANYAQTFTMPEAIGQVVWVKGEPKAAQPDAGPRPLARRSFIYAHDTLTTDETSSGEIRFTDNSVLSMREASTIKIDQYQYGKKTPDAFVANIAKGGFRTITGYISKNNPTGYKVTTPVATIGVSGTIYSVYFNQKKGTMAAKLDEGNIFITNDRGRLTLTKCPPNSSDTKCINQLYGEVTAPNAAPTAVAKQSAIFTNEPPITVVPAAPTTSATPSTTGTAGSFCIN
jgi:hypothetical protein